MQAVNPAFDKLFDTLQTKETDEGIALFSRRIHGNRTNLHDYIIPDVIPPKK